jgi:hypothetical protein
LIDFFWQLWTRGSGSDGGGVVAQAKGYVWTRWRWLGAASGGGGGRVAAAVGGGRIMVCDYCGVRCNVDT